MDNRDEYAYGWNEKGQRFHALKSGRREGRVNMIAALCNTESGLNTPFIEGIISPKAIAKMGLNQILLTNKDES
jgi:hypothetical protein